MGVIRRRQPWHGKTGSKCLQFHSERIALRSIPPRHAPHERSTMRSRDHKAVPLKFPQCLPDRRLTDPECSGDPVFNNLVPFLQGPIKQLLLYESPHLIREKQPLSGHITHWRRSRPIIRCQATIETLRCPVIDNNTCQPLISCRYLLVNQRFAQLRSGQKIKNLTYLLLLSIMGSDRHGHPCRRVGES